MTNPLPTDEEPLIQLTHITNPIEIHPDLYITNSNQFNCNRVDSDLIAVNVISLTTSYLQECPID